MSREMETIDEKSTEISSSPAPLRNRGNGGGMATPPLWPNNGRNGDEAQLVDSWIDVNLESQGRSGAPSVRSSTGFATPPFQPSTEEYLKLLKEAQKDGGLSSTLMSMASSRCESSHGTPPMCKSPLHTSQPELAALSDDLAGAEAIMSKEWLWDWSSRPNVEPPKYWKIKHPTNYGLSVRNAKIGKQSLFSKEVLWTLMLTNLMSICVGATCALWLGRARSSPS